MTDAYSAPYLLLGADAWRMAVDLAGLGMWAVDLDRSEVVLSEGAADLYHLAALKPLPIATWRSIVSEPDRARVIAAFDDAGTARHGDLRFQALTPDGRKLQLRERWRLIDSQERQSAALLGVVSDISDEAANEQRRRELIHELQHRMKNMLAAVRSIARRTATHSESLDDFSAHFEGRLAAIANVQATLARTQDGRADLEDIVRQELVHSLGSDDGIHISGPSVALRGRVVELIALALHELATNAVEFGSLSAGGRLAVAWERTARGADGRSFLRLDWMETGGSNVIHAAWSERSGFGHELIQRGLPYELDAEVDFDLSASGLSCRIVLPLSGENG